MKKASYYALIHELAHEDNRYKEDAYYFVREALDFTIKAAGKSQQNGPPRHVSGAELLDGIRQHAINEFGPMAMTVLASWGINETQDFGEIVFNMVHKGILGTSAEDRREHFNAVYNFDEAFRQPFLPQKLRKRKNSTKKNTTEEKT